MSKWIRKDDEVIVIAGNDKGRRGKVLSRLADRIVVAGINQRVRHVKRSPMNPGPGRITMEAPIHVSNVALCDEEGQPLKVRVAFVDNEKKLMARAKGKEEFVLRTIKKFEATKG